MAVFASGFLLPGGICFGILHWSNEQWEGRKAQGLPIEKSWSERPQGKKSLEKENKWGKKGILPLQQLLPRAGSWAGVGAAPVSRDGAVRMWRQNRNSSPGVQPGLGRIWGSISSAWRGKG